MTAKEKARELFLKFRQIPPFSPYTGIDDGEAKQCALIAVDEILETFPKEWNGFEYESCDEYWEQVKQELLKL